MMNRTLASFANAWRLATTMADDQQYDCAILKTEDPERPYVVAPYEAQPNAIALITSDPDVGLRWIGTQARTMPIGA